MEVEIKAWLYDILKAINEIESFFDNKRDFGQSLFNTCPNLKRKLK